MGTIAARGARDILFNTENVIAMEILASCQAIDLREKKTLGLGTQVAYDIIRNKIAFISEDIVMSPIIDKMRQLVIEGSLLNSVELKVGKLL